MLRQSGTDARQNRMLTANGPRQRKRHEKKKMPTGWQAFPNAPIVPTADAVPVISKTAVQASPVAIILPINDHGAVKKLG